MATVIVPRCLGEEKQQGSLKGWGPGPVGTWVVILSQEPLLVTLLSEAPSQGLGLTWAGKGLWCSKSSEAGPPSAPESFGMSQVRACSSGGGGGDRGG